MSDGNGPTLSLQGAPIQLLFESVRQQPAFAGKQFFFLIDEYENFQDYQQRVVNTLIKHSGDLYSFKIGVRELGWRIRNTLNEDEQLISPADYVRIDITEALRGAQFEQFALKVCNDRLGLVVDSDAEGPSDVQQMLPGMSEEEEAKKLDVDSQIGPIRAVLAKADDDSVRELSPLRAYLLVYWANLHKMSIDEVAQDFLSNPSRWETRFSNYSHALLYTLWGKRPGIRKYYSGWNTFVHLAGGNIRFLLQLVEESFGQHLREGKFLGSPVSQETQTKAAQRIGRTNLTELEGLAVRGARLTKLLLGLGRIFGVMAASLEGHSPEVNQFEVPRRGTVAQEGEVDSLLAAAVMHLALAKWSGSKLADEGDTRDWDYMVHPIYAPFFNFSYRRKRKMQLASSKLLGLVNSPQRAIREILAASHRVPDESLPEQLRLFETYYANQP